MAQFAQQELGLWALVRQSMSIDDDDGEGEVVISSVIIWDELCDPCDLGILQMHCDQSGANDVKLWVMWWRVREVVEMGDVWSLCGTTDSQKKDYTAFQRSSMEW